MNNITSLNAHIAIFFEITGTLGEKGFLFATNSHNFFNKTNAYTYGIAQIYIATVIMLTIFESSIND